MKLVLKLEELGMWVACIVLLYVSQVEWWWYLLTFIGPDISMVGYIVNNKVGAWSYNLFHHKGLAVVIIALGWIMEVFTPGPHFIMYTGLILFGHSSMDRFFGYGLKYENGFKFTHLGEIGKKV